jgi:hypothetical protein
MIAPPAFRIYIYIYSAFKFFILKNFQDADPFALRASEKWEAGQWRALDILIF